jgi:uroporphyrinogen III methyltransferase/synthase
LNAQQRRGIVHLVGAGPGDPQLLTVRGQRLLEAADVVVYDYLSNPRLLGYCPRAEAIYVGKKAASHTLSQAQINDLLVELARQGKRVVRLKGGDPFVFGRGGEEAEALRQAGIAFEIVPGITAAIAAPAYAGIPVTHRDFNSSFTLITGHEKEEAYRDPQSLGREPSSASDLDFSALAKLPCIAFYMGVKSLPRICARLIEHGMDPATPAASIQWGTTPLQRTVVATVSDLPQRVADAGIGAPAITIIGQVVSMRQTLNWFETRPLFGQTIVVTRTRQQASDLSARLEELGANVIEAPTIEITPADPSPVLAAIGEIAAGAFDWVGFSSANAVSEFKQRLLEAQLDARALAKVKIAVIGAATAASLQQQLGIRADLIPQRAIAEALSDELAAQRQIAGKRFALFRAEIGRPIIVERLHSGGAARVEDVAIYQTHPAAALPPALLEALDEKSVQWITFTSSSTVENFLNLLGENANARLGSVKLASIGPITSQTLRQRGFTPTVQATNFDIDGLIQAVLSHA